ncbi:MAG: hypothetical protein AAF471_07115 [Myxococcota bacterium]
MNENDLLHQMLYTGGSALLGLLGIGLGSLTNAWAAKVRNQALAQVIRNTNDVVMNVVKSVYEVHVRPRTRKHPLSGAQRRHIRATALRQVKDHLGREGIKNLRRAFGNDVDVDTVLRHHLEAAVRDLKDQRAGGNRDGDLAESRGAAGGVAELPSAKSRPGIDGGAFS